MRHAACPSLLPRNEKAALDVDQVDEALAKDSKRRAEGSQSHKAIVQQCTFSPHRAKHVVQEK